MTTEKLIPTLFNTISSKHVPLRTSRDGFVYNVVKPSGYPFFEWNDRVYQMNVDDLPYKDTGVLFKDLSQVSKEGVLAHLSTLPGWDEVNDIISDIQSQAREKFGPDFSSPAYDE